MKWPSRLILVRHDVSAFNAMKARKEADPDYVRMKQLYEQADLSEAEHAELIACAHRICAKHGLKDVGDWNTPLADVSSPLARAVGARLKEMTYLPDVVFVSPYIRTLDTLAGLRVGWPELAGVKTVEDDRLREQEHGLATLFNDWRAFQSLHPEQRRLREAMGRYWYQYPQGESVPDVRERMRSFANTLTRDFAGKQVLCVTHHLTILAWRANMERWDAARFIDVDENDKPRNAGVTIYEGYPDQGSDGRLLLREYNTKLYD